MPIVIGQKVIGGLLAILFVFNLNIINLNKFDIKFFNHEEYMDYVNFYSICNIYGKEYTTIIQLEKNENANIKRNETDDLTPGSFKIIIQNKKGEKIVIDKNYGSKDKHSFDKIFEEKIANELTEYISSMKNTSLKDKIINSLNSFVNYCNRDTREKKWFNKHFK